MNQHNFNKPLLNPNIFVVVFPAKRVIMNIIQGLRTFQDRYLSVLLSLLLIICATPTWTIHFGQAANLSNYTLPIAQTPQVAINSNGNAIAIWQEGTGAEVLPQIFARYYSTDFWGPAAALSNPNNTGYNPNIAMDNNGNAIAVWWEYDNTNNTYLVYADPYSSGSWGTAQLLSDDLPIGRATNPQIAMDNSGNARAIWNYSDINISPVYNVSTRSYNFSSEIWSATDQLNTNSVNYNEFPQIAMINTGTATAVWIESNDLGIYNIYARRYTGSTWIPALGSPAINLNYSISSTASGPQIAMDDDGNATAVWIENNGGINNIYTARYSHGSWGTAQNLNNNTGSIASTPQIAMDDLGNAIAVWIESNGGIDNIYTSRYTGGTWGPAESLNNNTASTASSPQIAMADNDTAIAVWVEIYNSQQNIFARQYNNNTWGVVTNINNFTFRPSIEPQIAMNASNQAVIVSSENERTYARVVTPITLDQILAVNSAGNAQVIWQKAQNDTGSANIVQTTQPTFLPTNGTVNTTLSSGESSGIFMDGNGNAWTFILSGSTLTQCVHTVTAPIDQWECSITATGVSEWAAAVNLLSTILNAHIDENGTLFGTYNRTTLQIANTACSVNAALSGSGNNNAAIAFIGNCLLTRADSSTTGDVIAATFNLTSQSWVLSGTLASNASNPQIQVDNNFNVTVIWQWLYDDVNNLYQIQAAHGTFTPAQTWDWSDTITLTPATNNAQAVSPQLVIDASGNAIALWEYTDATYTYTVIQAEYYIFNATWTDLTTLSPTDSNASSPSISMDSAGNAIAVWLIPYFNGTDTVTRVQGSYFNATQKIWTAITNATRGNNSSYISPSDSDADSPAAALGANQLGLVAYTLSNTSLPMPNNVYTNNVLPAQSIITNPTQLFPNAGNYQAVSCAYNSANINGVASINMATRQPGGNTFTHVALTSSSALSYGLVQWGCALNGAQKYLVAVNAVSPSIDMYVYDPTTTPSLSYKQTLNLASETGVINDVALYNKDDTNIYLAIATQNNVQIQLWDGNQFNLLDILVTTSNVNTLCWWVDGTNPDYAAYLATADIGQNVNIYGLSQTYTFNLIDSRIIGTSPFTAMLWYVKTDVSGNITLLDLIGGGTTESHEYTINVNVTDKTITYTKQNSIPQPMGGLSTCNTFLAIGDYGATSAAISLYNVDTSNGTITLSTSVIPDSDATHVYYLAKCCTGNPAYLLAGVGDEITYTLYVYTPDLLTQVAEQTLGTFVNSVAWCCTGANSYLAATYNDITATQAGEIYQLDTTHVPPLIDLGPIAY